MNSPYQFSGATSFQAKTSYSRGRNATIRSFPTHIPFQRSAVAVARWSSYVAPESVYMSSRTRDVPQADLAGSREIVPGIYIGGEEAAARQVGSNHVDVFICWQACTSLMCSSVNSYAMLCRVVARDAMCTSNFKILPGSGACIIQMCRCRCRIKAMPFWYFFQEGIVHNCSKQGYADNLREAMWCDRWSAGSVAHQCAFLVAS